MVILKEEVREKVKEEVREKVRKEVRKDKYKFIFINENKFNLLYYLSYLYNLSKIILNYVTHLKTYP
jgi:hypothetical protein